MKRLRGSAYRDDLDHLTDQQWLYAVRQARQRRWFPSVEELLDYAEAAPQPKRPALSESRMDPVTAKAVARQGLHLVETELKARGFSVPRPCSPMLSREEQEQRREMLAEQAKAIGGKS